MAKTRVFIIDDEPDLVKTAQAVLEKHNFVVNSDTNPIEGLKKIRDHPPDLILLDINMEEMNGLDVCREIKADPKICDIPIIIISVMAEEADVVLGLEMGADDYIRKPLQRRELLARVKTVLRRKGPDSPPSKT